MGIENSEMAEDFEIEIVDDSEQHAVQGASDGTGEEQGGEEVTERSEGGKRKSKKQKAEERISELTRKYRDEERKRLELERQREQERQQFQSAQSNFQQERQQYAQIVSTELEARKELLEERLHEARNRADSKREVKIQDELDKVRSRLGQVRSALPQQGQQAQPAAEPTQQQSQPQPQQQQPAAQIPEAAKQWVESNSFLRSRSDVHQTVNAAYEQLAREQDVSDPSFYTELNNRLKQELPAYLADRLVDPNAAEDYDEPEEDEDDQDEPERPAAKQPVSGANRGTQTKSRSKRRVQLTRDEVAMAKKLGVSPEDYAKQKTSNNTVNGYTQIGG